jgi:hypothetical protein
MADDVQARPDSTKPPRRRMDPAAIAEQLFAEAPLDSASTSTPFEQPLYGRVMHAERGVQA